MSDRFFFNGTLCNAADCRLPVTDRSYLLGDGLFETILVKSGRALRLPEHLRRLLASCAYFNYNRPTAQELTAAIQSVIAANALETATLRLTLSPRESQGILAAPASPLNILITFRRGEPYAPALYERGFTAVIAGTRRNEFSPASRHKTTNFLDSVLARKEAQSSGADEAILLNTQGRLAEGSVTNLFLVSSGAVLTPRIEDGALPGIMRAKVLELCRAKGIPAREQALTPADLERAEEAFFTNSLMLIMPLSKADKREIAHPGPITALLAKNLR